MAAADSAGAQRIFSKRECGVGMLRLPRVDHSALTWTNLEAATVSTALNPPFIPAAWQADAADGARSHSHWRIWRSPAGQPGWARPVLLAIAALAAALYAWNITSAGLAPFYSVAVKSMSESWKAFFYGAFDPQATITIDKLAGSFLPQALSARIFGFHAWSLALPQVIFGVISVLVMYRVVRRWAGVTPGILAALLFTLTPIAASMFGHSMEDGALTMCLVLAADAWQRAAIEGRLRPLIAAGVWIGLGFQAKMLQAWMILPALFLGYLIAAPPRPLTRVWQLATAGAVMLAASLSWIALYTFTPAADRPYVDGSTDNSAFAMVFGYNGLERFGITVPGAVTSGPGITVSGGGGIARVAGGGVTAGPTGVPAGGITGGFGTGWTKLLGSTYGTQIGWLYPLALLALGTGLLWTVRARRADPARGGFLMWGTWLVTVGLVFSKMRTIPHTAYMASLAPPLAALSAVGIVMFWRLYRSGDRRGWLFPVALLAELAWAAFLWRAYSGFLPWALAAALVAGVAAAIVLVAARLSHRTRLRVITIGLAAGTAAMLAGPATWAASVLDTKYGGSSFNANAGPAGDGFGAGAGGGGTFPGRAAMRERFADFFPGGTAGPADVGRPGGAAGTGGGGVIGAHGGTSALGGAGAADGFASRGEFPGASEIPGFGGFGGGAGGLLGATKTLTSAEQAIYSYVSTHRGGASYLMAVTSWTQASPYIISTGQEVMPMGGFSGSVPSPTLARVRELVRTRQLRFFLLGGAGGPGGFGARGGSGAGTVTAIESWVRSACTAVPASAYGGAQATVGGQTLYQCSPSA